MKLVIAGKNPAAESSEVVILGFAPRPGAAWSLLEEKGFVSADGDDSSQSWRRRDFVPRGDEIPAPSLFGFGTNLSIRLSGPWPLIMFLSHPWSGVVDIRIGPHLITLDLYHPTPRVVLVDPMARLVVELAQEDVFAAGKIRVRARSALDLIGEAVLNGRPLQRLRASLRGVRWLESRGYLPGGVTRATRWQRQHFLLSLPFGIGWLLSGGPFRARQSAIQFDVLSSIVESLLVARRISGSTNGNNHQSVEVPQTDVHNQLKLLAAAVDGLSRWSHHRSKTP